MILSAGGRILTPREGSTCVGLLRGFRDTTSQGMCFCGNTAVVATWREFVKLADSFSMTKTQPWSPSPPKAWFSKVSPELGGPHSTQHAE